MKNEDTIETKSETTSTKTVLTLVVYCISGSLLTIVNKLAIAAFPFTNMLLVLQNGTTVVLLLLNFYWCALSAESMPPLNRAIIQMWLPVVFLFVLMLMSSLISLVYVSVPTVIVIRNLSTLSVAVLEYFALGRTISTLSIGTLLGMLLGAVFYAIHDLTFSIYGYIWLAANILGTSLYQVYIKKIVDMPLVKDIGPIGMSYYNNLISLPVFIVLAILMGEFKALLSFSTSITAFNMKSTLIVFLSCILGFLLSTSAFALNKLISATSIMVANNVNKFSLIILSEVLVQSTLDITASVGAISVLFFGWLYSQAKERFSKPLFLFGMFVFIVSYIILELGYAFIPMIHENILTAFASVEQHNVSFPYIRDNFLNRGNSTALLDSSAKNRTRSIN